MACRNDPWPFQVFVKAGGVVHRYQPESAFGYTTFNETTLMPAMIGAVVNASNGEDKYRMLCEGMAAVRTINEIAQRPEQAGFVVMVIYVTDQLVAERYILYLPRENDRHVSQPSGCHNSELTRALRSTFFARISTSKNPK